MTAFNTFSPFATYISSRLIVGNTYTQQACSPPPVCPVDNKASFPMSVKNIGMKFHDPDYPRCWGAEHAGTDYMAQGGTEVYSVFEGVVHKNFTYRELMSSFLIIKHWTKDGDVYGYYGHILSDLENGSRINKGSVIGTVREWDDDPSNSHLHFGINDDYLIKGWGRTPTGTDPTTKGWSDPESLFT